MNDVLAAWGDVSAAHVKNDFLLLNIRTALLTFGGRTRKVGVVNGYTIVED